MGHEAHNDTSLFQCPKCERTLLEVIKPDVEYGSRGQQPTLASAVRESSIVVSAHDGNRRVIPAGHDELVEHYRSRRSPCALEVERWLISYSEMLAALPGKYALGLDVGAGTLVLPGDPLHAGRVERSA